MDITDIILTDHEDQRRMFSRLDQIDPDDHASLGAVWKRLSTMLEVHAQAEEELFYPELLKLGERLHDDSEVEETKDAIGDHNDIRDGALEAEKHRVGTKAWWKGVNDCREANDEHMGEEEHEGLTDFRRHVSLADRHEIAVKFLVFECTHVDGVPVKDKDPDAYIEDNS